MKQSSREAYRESSCGHELCGDMSDPYLTAKPHASHTESLAHYAHFNGLKLGLNMLCFQKYTHSLKGETTSAMMVGMGRIPRA